MPVNQASPFDQLTAAAASTVFFQFDALATNPTDINDLAGTAAITFPDGDGFPSDREQYDLSDAPLDSSTLYRVTMFGRLSPAEVTPTFAGVGDCPLIQSLGGDNVVSICFGLNDPLQNAICADQVPFTSCPGI